MTYKVRVENIIWHTRGRFHKKKLAEQVEISLFEPRIPWCNIAS